MLETDTPLLQVSRMLIGYPLWAPNAIQYDLTFNNREFNDFLSSFNMQTRPIPARRRCKIVLESKHEIIGDIFLKIKGNSETISDAIAVQ